MRQTQYKLSMSLCLAGSLGAGPMQLQRSLPLAFAADGTDVVNTHAARPGRMVLAEFLRRLLRLSALRLADLCERMDFHPVEPGNVLTQVWPAWQLCCLFLTYLPVLQESSICR